MSDNIHGVIAIDDGGSSTCVVTKNKFESFPSVKGEYGERHLTSANGKYDYIVEYRGEKYVMGMLAKYDCAMPMQMHTDSKQNYFFDLSVLVSIHQFGYMSNNVIVSAPIEMHTPEEKEGRKKRLEGSHTITVNGIRKTFAINRIEVAPEGAVAYWVNEPQGKNRFLDLGSRTVNYATTINEYGETRFIDTESGTMFGKGLEALDRRYNPKSLADYICGRLTKMWGENDKIYILGGGANDIELISNIGKYFNNIEIMDKSHMVNALGMYNLGRLVFDMS